MSALGTRALASFIIRALVIATILFISAGSIDFWQAWIFVPVLLVPHLLMGAYFLRHNPAFLERRLKIGVRAESRFPQKVIMFVLALLFSSLLTVAGLDHRFGWSQIPPALSIAAEFAIALGIFIQFRVFKANSFASATIGIESKQTLISTGPYAIVRHPMYIGSILVNFFAPVALGSWRALPLSVAMLMTIALRILDEEKLLCERLPGYQGYCRKVPYRLIPRIW